MELFKSRTRVVYTNAVGDKVYPVVVDIKKGIKSTEDIQFVSSDVNTGILSVAFIQGNDNYNVTGANVVCSVMRPDASTLELPCEVVRENIVEVPLGINGTSQDGVYSFDFKVLKGGNKVVGTPIMNYSVSLSIGNDMAVEEDDRLPILTMLITQVNELKEETSETINQANIATEASKEATANAIEATNNANAVSERVSQEIATAIAEIKQDTENAIDSINQSTSTAISTMNQNTTDAIADMTQKTNEAVTRVNDNLTNINNTVATKVSELDTAKSDMTNTVSNKVNEVETRFNALTSSQQQDAEVIDARDGETSLKARLDRDIEKAKQVYVNVEGSNISTDSSSGYLKDVEILGNTIQSASNLADIRSVGDTVEGQELYEIPVLSTNNIIDVKSTMIGDEAIHYNIEPIRQSFEVMRLKGYTVSILIYKNNSWQRNVVIKTNTLTAINLNDGEYVNQILLYAQDGWDLSKQYNLTNIIHANIKLEHQQLTILSPTPLEKVGDVRDRIIEKDGVWGVEKNVGSVIFDGTENWGANSTSSNDNYRTVYVKPSNYASASFSGLCDKLPTTYNNSILGTTKCIYFGGNINISIPVSELKTNDLVGAKTWLQVNPILVKYITTDHQFIPLPHDQQVKLRTFANKTNISFLTEIEGTIKAQVPKSLGATVNTHTEQISNLNKELDRVKKLEESTVSTVTTESDFTTVEATSNGYFEDVKLEGKTLVVNSSNEVVEPGTEGATLKSVGDGVDEIVVSSVINKFKHPYLVENGKAYLYNNGSLITNAQYNTSHFLIDNGEQHFINFNLNDGIDIHITYWNDSTFISGVLVKQSVNLDVPNNCNKILLTYDTRITDILLYSQQDKKRLLYYNEETQTWEKPILREWDSIEKHSNGKYYYHQRSEEVVLNGSENWSVRNDLPTDNPQGTHLVFYVQDENFPIKARPNDTSSIVWISDIIQPLSHAYGWNTSVEGLHFGTFSKSQGANNCRYYINITKSKLSTQDVQGFKQWLQANNITVVYQLAQEKVYECTNIDLITYANETNYVVECGTIVPRTTLKVHNNISNVVNILQEKVSLLESNVKASQEVQDMMILETDMRMLDIELALMEFAPIKLNLGGSDMLRSATYFNFLKNHIINETYEKGYLENVMNKYLATGRINQDEYDELYNMLYPPVYDIELPIEP